MPPVLRTDQAEADLAEILEYLEQHSAEAAERLADAIDNRCSLLGEFPQMGRARDDLMPGVLSIAVEQYVLFYRISSSAVEVLRILHGARDIDTIMKKD